MTAIVIAIKMQRGCHLLTNQNIKNFYIEPK